MSKYGSNEERRRNPAHCLILIGLTNIGFPAVYGDFGISSYLNTNLSKEKNMHDFGHSFLNKHPKFYTYMPESVISSSSINPKFVLNPFSTNHQAFASNLFSVHPQSRPNALN